MISPMTFMRAYLGPAAGALALLAGLTILGLGAAAPSSAQVFGSAPYQPGPDPAVVQLQGRIDTLESDLRKATGRVEQMTFEVNKANKAASDANAGRAALEQQVQALTARMATLERLALGETGDAAAAQAAATAGPRETTINLTPAPAPTAGGAFDTAALPADEAGVLKEARNLLLAGDYPSAEKAAVVYFEKFPKGESASEAQYLLGESRLLQERYPDAAEAYVKLVSTYPKSARAPDGLLKLARSMRLMGEKAEACKALTQLSSKYPQASAVTKSLAATEKSRAGC